MTIGEFIKVLEALPKGMIISNVNLSDYGSDRGDYYNFYLGESTNKETNVREIIELLKTKVIGKTFTGYKGGDFVMNENTLIKLGAYSCCGSDIDGVLVEYDYTRGAVAKVKAQQVLYY
jgi:hypothetical protein